MDATLPDEFLLPTDQEIPSGGAPCITSTTLLAGVAVLLAPQCGGSRCRVYGSGTLLVGVWSSRKAESPIQLIEGRTEVGSQTGRFPGRKEPQISAPLFQPAQCPHKKTQQLKALKIESFTASTAEPRKVQLCEGGVSTKGKLRNRKNFITNKLDIHLETQSESQQLQR